ncbi:MAG: M56 family metallopeptidase [Capsulimonas sp.]|uniref:M56 family metallopeptidase n=1 Tax=Capsulimonas sp. TaxID=2494211 RepID=UPI0032660F28
MISLQSILVFAWLDAAVKATALLALTAAIAGCARRASASSRHLIWTLGLACSFVLPLLSATLPHWNASVPASSVPHRLTLPTELQAVTPPILATHTPTPSAHIPEVPKPVGLISNAPPSAAESPKLPTSTVATISSDAAPRPAIWPWVLCAIWAAGGLLMSIRLSLSILAVRRLGRESTVIASEILIDAAERAARTIPTSFGVVVRQSTNAGIVRVPITWGARRPVILLPTEAAQWPQERVLAALLHERAHIRRWDWPTLMLAQIVCAVYWFHPLAWLCADKMRQASETACDDLVVLSGMPAVEYARQLLEVSLAARKRGRFGFGAVAMAQKPGVEGRLKTILAMGLARRPITWRGTVTAGAAALLVAIPLAMLRLETKSTAEGREISGGMSLQVLGVSYDPSSAHSWWNSSGADITQPTAIQNDKSDISPKPGWLTRQIVFQAIGASPDADFKFVAPHINIARSWRDGGNRGKICEGVNISFPSEMKTAEIRVVVATTPWQTIASVSAASGGSGAKFINGVKYNVSIAVPSRGQHGERSYSISDNVSDQDIRVIALDNHGNALSGNLNQYPDESGILQRYAYFVPPWGIKLARIQIQARPYQWTKLSQISLNPTTNHTTALSRERQAATHLAHAMRLQSQRANAGVTDLRQAVQLDPSNPMAVEKLATAIYNFNIQVSESKSPGILKANADLRHQAIALMRKAVRLSPNDPRYRATLGEFLIDDQRYQEAITQLRREQMLLATGLKFTDDYHALTDTTHHGEALEAFTNHEYLGRALQAVGDNKSAVIEYEQALQYDFFDGQNNYYLLVDYGKALNSCGRRAEARAAWKKVLQQGRNDRDFYWRMAKNLLAQNP